jgi:glutathione S-transferase
MALTLHVGQRNYSSWSMRPFVLMRQLDIDVTVLDVDIRGNKGQANPEIKSVSPSGLVPVLEADGFRVWDSLAIIEYVNDRFPDKGVWPADLKARARARCISAEMHSGFTHLRGGLPMNIKMRLVGPLLGVSREVAADIARIEELWTDARTNFADASAGPYLFGAFTAADAMFAPVIFRLLSYNIKPHTEVGAAYMAAMLECLAVREWEDAALAEGPAKAIGHYDEASRAIGGADRPVVFDPDTPVGEPRGRIDARDPKGYRDRAASHEGAL